MSNAQKKSEIEKRYWRAIAGIIVCKHSKENPRRYIKDAEKAIEELEKLGYSSEAAALRWNLMRDR